LLLRNQHQHQHQHRDGRLSPACLRRRLFAAPARCSPRCTCTCICTTLRIAIVPPALAFTLAFTVKTMSAPGTPSLF